MEDKDKTIDELATEGCSTNYQKDFTDLHIFGETLYYRDGQRINPKDVLIGDVDCTIKTEKLSAKEILERYKDYLTDEEKENINNHGRNE